MTRVGLDHKSMGDKLVGTATQENRCWVVWSAASHSGQVAESERPNLAFVDARRWHSPERSWANVDRSRRLRLGSSAEILGGMALSTGFGLCLAMDLATKSVWSDLRVAL